MVQRRKKLNKISGKATPEQVYDMKVALLAVIKDYGSQAALARAVGIKQPSVAGAVARGRASATLAQRIHRATSAVHPRWKLRPDLFDRAD